MTFIQQPDAAASLLTLVSRHPTVLLYVGPDQIMPLTSVLTALAGIALLFWNRLLGLFQKFRALFMRRVDEPRKPSAQ
jgi:hypothetical protein